MSVLMQMGRFRNGADPLSVVWEDPGDKNQTKTYPDKYCSALCLVGRQEDALRGEREKEG